MLLTYVVGWTTDVFSLNLNASGMHLSAGPGTFFALLVLAVTVTVVGGMRGRPWWRRNTVLLLVGAAPAVSWYVLGKSHAYTATPVCYVLWYLIFIPLLVWILGSAIGGSALAGTLARAFRRGAESSRERIRRRSRRAPEVRSGGRVADPCAARSRRLNQ